MQEKREAKSPHRFCPKCGSPKMKRRDELTADEKFLVERMSTAGDDSSGERRRRLYCARCFYEITDDSAERA